jgi:hypothetical protein
MAFGDKVKNLAKQAQDAVVEHKDQIQGAVDAVSVAADRKTKGKYTARIQTMGQKAGAAVDKLGGEEPPADAAAPPATGTPSAAGATPPPATGTPPPATGAPASGPPADEA